jgi:hypothetical protein
MGSGYRTFTAGEILTASNVQNFLQDQAVMVFAGTAARSSAIGTANFEEGMLTYLTDVDKLQVYTGATFADVYPAAASTQGLTLINTTSFSAVASQSINDVFSATYNNYAIVVSAVFSNAGSINMRLRVAGSDNTTANSYVRQVVEANNTSVSTSRATSTGWPLGGFGTALVNLAIVDITNPFLASATGFFSRIERSLDSAVVHISAGTHNQTTSYTGFTIYPDAGTMTGSVSVYGYNL